MEANKSPKISYRFHCDKCNYKCSKQSEYNKHLLTRKHLMEADGSKKISNWYQCDFCEKKYRSRGSLWKHQRSCTHMSTNTDIHLITTDQLPGEHMNNTGIVQTMMHLIEQNHEFKTLLIEQQRDNLKQQNENKKLQQQLIEAVKDSGNIYNTTTNNNNNQSFNLNFFLNTTCKDAMNMTDFIENMEVEFKDIENIGKQGYVTGMTDMILTRIKELDVTKRPLHCTDLKRETMYIKDNNEWSKDTPDNSKLHKMIDYVAKQNYAKIPLWREQHPECQLWDHPQYDFCVSMMRNILGDVGSDQKRLDNKVVKNLSRHIYVEKGTT